MKSSACHNLSSQIVFPGVLCSTFPSVSGFIVVSVVSSNSMSCQISRCLIACPTLMCVSYVQSSVSLCVFKPASPLLIARSSFLHVNIPAFLVSCVWLLTSFSTFWLFLCLLAGYQYQLDALKCQELHIISSKWHKHRNSNLARYRVQRLYHVYVQNISLTNVMVQSNSNTKINWVTSTICEIKSVPIRHASKGVVYSFVVSCKQLSNALTEERAFHLTKRTSG